MIHFYIWFYLHMIQFFCYMIFFPQMIHLFSCDCLINCSLFFLHITHKSHVILYNMIHLLIFFTIHFHVIPPKWFIYLHMIFSVIFTCDISFTWFIYHNHTYFFVWLMCDLLYFPINPSCVQLVLHFIWSHLHLVLSCVAFYTFG